MWCVPELNDRYIANMEDVLAVFEKAYSPKQPVIGVAISCKSRLRGSEPRRVSTTLRQSVKEFTEYRRLLLLVC